LQRSGIEDTPLTTPAGTTPFNLGFLSVFRDVQGYLGGYLVTNGWGRPLEFRLTTAVQPGRVHQILYGETLDRYLCADLIGKALFDKTATSVALLLTDTEAVLDLRRHVQVPVARLRHTADDGKQVEPVCHAAFPDDDARVRTIRARLDPALDLTEPFERIREAIAEARKLGVTSRAA
jgi:hypothetical protein